MGTIDHYTCPRKQVPDSHPAWDAIRYYGWREKGMLPVGGGVLDQSSTFLRACQFIDHELEERRQREQKKRGSR